jgi:hypothetical protein
MNISSTCRKHTYKTKDRVTRTQLKTGGELRCSGRKSSSCSTSDTRRVNLDTNPVISYERGKNREVLTTSGRYVHFTRSLVLYVCFVDRCLDFCTFPFGHRVVCSSIYGFRLPLWYLQTLLTCFNYWYYKDNLVISHALIVSVPLTI